jgi:hypothetical protein
MILLLIPIQSLMDPGNNLISYFFERDLNIIYTLTLKSPKWWTKIMYAFFFLCMRAACPVHYLIFLIFVEEYKL